MAGLEPEYKFLLEVPPDEGMLDQWGTRALVVQHYLIEQQPGVTRRIRCKTVAGSQRYFYTEKQAAVNSGEYGGADVRGEDEVEITHLEYSKLAAQRDFACAMILKWRWSAGVGESALCEVDHLLAPVALWLVELEVKDAVAPRSVLPHWLAVGDDVSHDHRYKMAAVAAGSLGG